MAKLPLMTLMKKNRKHQGIGLETEESLFNKLKNFKIPTLQQEISQIPELADKDILRDKIQVLESMLEWEPQIFHKTISNVLCALCMQAGEYRKTAELMETRGHETRDLSCLVNRFYLNVKLKKFEEAKLDLEMIKKNINHLSKVLMRSDIAFIYTKCSPQYYVNAVSVYEVISNDTEAKGNLPDMVVTWNLLLAVCYRRLIRNREHMSTVLKNQNLENIHALMPHIQALHECIQIYCLQRSDLRIIEGRSVADCAMAFFKYEPLKTSHCSKEGGQTTPHNIANDFSRAMEIAGDDHSVSELYAIYLRTTSSDEEGYSKCIEILTKIYSANPKRHPVMCELSKAHFIRWVVRHNLPEAKLYLNDKRNKKPKRRQKRKQKENSKNAKSPASASSVKQPWPSEAGKIDSDVSSDTAGLENVEIRSDSSDTGKNVHPSRIGNTHSSDSGSVTQEVFSAIDKRTDSSLESIDTQSNSFGSTTQVHPSEIAKLHSTENNNYSAQQDGAAKNNDYVIENYVTEVSKESSYKDNALNDTDFSSEFTDSTPCSSQELNKDNRFGSAWLIEENTISNADLRVHEVAFRDTSKDKDAIESALCSSQTQTVLPRKPSEYNKKQKQPKQPGYFDKLKASNPKVSPVMTEERDIEIAVQLMDEACKASFYTRYFYLIELGRLYVTTHDYSKANECFQKANATKGMSHTDYAYLYEQWGLVLAGNRSSAANERHAIQLFRQSVEHSVQGYQRSRLAYYKLRDYLKSCDDADETTAGELMNLELLMEKFNSVKHIAGKTIYRQPYNTHLMWGLVYSLYKIKKYNEAYSHLVPLLMELPEDNTLPNFFEVSDLLSVIVNAAKSRKECGINIYATCFRYFAHGGIITSCECHPPRSRPTSIDSSSLDNVSGDISLIPSGNLTYGRKKLSDASIVSDDLENENAGDLNPFKQNSFAGDIGNVDNNDAQESVELHSEASLQSSVVIDVDAATSYPEMIQEVSPVPYDIVVIGGPASMDSCEQPPHVGAIEKLLKKANFEVTVCCAHDGALKTYLRSEVSSTVVERSTGILIIIDEYWYEGMFKTVQGILGENTLFCCTQHGEMLPPNIPFDCNVVLENIEENNVDSEHDLLGKIFTAFLSVEDDKTHEEHSSP